MKLCFVIDIALAWWYPFLPSLWQKATLFLNYSVFVICLCIGFRGNVLAELLTC